MRVPGCPRLIQFPTRGGSDIEAMAVDPNTALNGAQVTAMVDIVGQVALGQLPRSSGVEMIIAAFPVDRSTAERIMGDAGRGFTPTASEPPPVVPSE